ncbi:uncharacterized protein F4812DRAFT_92951 [Daldinia caldariorum]|uniref:uncharacterized protein n=1 Tax=Daldinia caldariorum TaxID=326644 RepID=UPI002007FF5B|nr:uncharacterized protein F4812DRAFT_92951 [Daldinia caldariorum]KAI1466003.1 hypothetical protein F4812DRAFT_92951 [Daldinia caldariorum]
MSEAKQPSTAASSADVEKTASNSSEAAGTAGPVGKKKHINKDDPDEALKLVAGEAVVLTPEDEKRLLKKIDRNLMPLLCVVYGLNYLDKTTLSYASIMGIKKLTICVRRRQISTFKCVLTGMIYKARIIP